MRPPATNIPPEIEEAIAQGREMGLREAAAYLRDIKEIRVPWLVRGLGGGMDTGEVGPDGWSPLKPEAKKLLDSTAHGVERLINHEDLPPHEHLWCPQSDKTDVCATCGHSRPTPEP